MYASADPHGQLSVAAPPKPDVEGLAFFLLLGAFLANRHVVDTACRYAFPLTVRCFIEKGAVCPTKETTRSTTT